MKTNNNTVGTLLMDYINAGGDTTFMSTPSPEMESQAKAGAEGGYSISTEAAEKSLSTALTALDNLGIDTTAANSAYFDYLTANAETKGRALTNAITAVNTAIDTAIAEQQAAGADTSALTALKAQLDSALSAAGQGHTGNLSAYGRYLSMIEKVDAAKKSSMDARAFAQSLGVPSTLTDAEAALGARMQAKGIEKAMANTVSGARGTAPAYSADTVASAVGAVQALPKGALSNAEYYGVMNAYYAYGLNPTDANAQTVINMVNEVTGVAENAEAVPDVDEDNSVDNSSAIDYNLVKEYVRDIEERTGIGLHKKQIEKLKNALRNKEYKKLSPLESWQHRSEFKKIKNDLIVEWEENTVQVWPVYKETIISTENGKILRKAGRKYDAHHIIESSFGGDNTWWNIHPARFPDVHQAGIHGTGSPANRLFDGGNYDY